MDNMLGSHWAIVKQLVSTAVSTKYELNPVYVETAVPKLFELLP